MKTLILKPRSKNTRHIRKNGQETEEESYNWHDSTHLSFAIEIIASNIPSIVKQAPWLQIASKITLAVESLDGESDKSPIEIDLNEQEIKLLWKHLQRIPARAFGRRLDQFGRILADENGKVIQVEPHLGTLYLMLSDIAQQLEVELKVDYDE